MFEIEAINDAGEIRYVYIGAYSEGAGGLHSEEIIDGVISKYKRDGWSTSVLRIYSEYAICSECSIMLNSKYPDAKIYWSSPLKKDYHDFLILDYLRKRMGLKPLYPNGIDGLGK